MVELPEDIAQEESIVKPFDTGNRARQPVLDEKSVKRAVEILGRAEKPISLAGNGCVRTRASKQLNRFVDRTGIHAANTFIGKGAISARHDRCLFATGLGLKGHVSYVFSKADLVICIGKCASESSTVWHLIRPSISLSKVWSGCLKCSFVKAKFTIAEYNKTNVFDGA